MASHTAESRGEKRRDEILKAALALFNARGSHAVSTNHIAAELRISVGNLYWHFRDKEAIVRALYEQHDRNFDGLWTRPPQTEQAIATALASLRRVFAITWEYRFLYRELPALARADPELRKMHAAARERRHGELRAFQVAFIDLGVLRIPGDEPQLALLEDLSWMIPAFWLPHVELRDGTVTKRAVLEGARTLLALYAAYATEPYVSRFRSALQDLGADR